MKLASNKLDLLKCAGIVTLSLLLITAPSTRTQAQSLQLGVKAGANYTKIGGNSFDGTHYLGLSAGVYGKLNFSSRWYLQPEINYNETVAQTSDAFNQIYGGASQQMVYLQYASIPVLLGFKPLPQLSLLVGPQYSFLFAQTSNLFPYNQGQKAFNKSDIAIVFGGQANFNKIVLGVRYQVGLANIGYQSTDTWKQYGFQFYVGYQLGDMKLKK